jgi:hypothetical protein
MMLCRWLCVILVMIGAPVLYAAENAPDETRPEHAVHIVLNTEARGLPDRAILLRMLRGYHYSWPEGQLVTVILPAKASTAHEPVAQYLFQASGRTMTRHWLKMVFSGQATAPVYVDSDAETILQIQRSPNAIGIIANPPAVLPDNITLVGL